MGFSGHEGAGSIRRTGPFGAVRASPYHCNSIGPSPLHALSLPTWWIHVASVLEWAAAMLAVQRFGQIRREPAWRWLSLAMVPALASAMAVSADDDDGNAASQHAPAPKATQELMH